MRANATVHVSPADRKRLEALVADRNTPAKVVWRAGIILATADGHGTNEIMRKRGSEPTFRGGPDRGVMPGHGRSI